MYPVCINNIHLHLDPGNSPSSTSPTVKLSWPWSLWALWRGTSPPSLAQRASWGCSLVMGIPGIGLKNDPQSWMVNGIVVLWAQLLLLGLCWIVFFSVLFLIIHSCFFFSSPTCSERHWQEEPEKGGMFFRKQGDEGSFSCRLFCCHVDLLTV